MLQRFRPPDLVACLTVCVCGTLLGLGKDHIIALSLLAVIAGYYGIEITPLGDWLKIKRNRRQK